MTVSLTNRLLVFFLATLALVLAGFSTSLYLLARTYLGRQVDERLVSALGTLEAFVEHESPGLEWEIKDRRVAVGGDAAPDAVCWLVRDEHGRRVDRSPNLTDDHLADALFTFRAEDDAPQGVTAGGATWRLAQRRVADARSAERDLPADRYAELTLTAAVPLAPLHALLRNLALLLAGLSLVVWVLAALGGRLLCRRALLPVTRMAVAARGINAAALDQRLPTPATGDELAELSGAFNDLLARLQESFERQRRFTGDASHQLRTPLTAMLGQVEVALRRPRPTAEYERVLGLVRDQAEHLRQIVEVLLFLARADAEGRRPRLDRFDLTAWLHEHVRSWSDHGRATDLRVENTPDAPLWVCAQAPLLGQLLDNVWDNACKYSAPGTPIIVRVGTAADRVWLSVEDRGSGIPAEELPHVFEPFYRSPHARPVGVGLGLAVVQRIAAALGGEVALQSAVGQGCMFCLRLPLAESCP